MPRHHVSGAPLDFGGLRTELELPAEFPTDVLADAEQSAANPALPSEDATDIPFVTVDPPGSKDLDQAVHLERSDQGFVVHYAIADVAAFVRPGSPLDAEANRRGETVYFPDGRVPLHPPLLSEGAASLLPDQTRPAVVWRIEVAADGTISGVTVRRALVRSTAQLDYPSLQQAVEAKTAHPSIALLPEIGGALIAEARTRHAIDLDLPSQEVEPDDGSWTITFQSPLPVERFNAQISLLTGRCAGRLMLDAKVGILRTVPAPNKGAIGALRRIAPKLGVDWPDGAQPGDVLSLLDRANPHHVVFLDHAGSLLRGSSYAAFDGAHPAESLHAGVGAPYSHVTAPLRRLVDRYASEVCLAVVAGQPVPDWVRERLPTLPEAMKESNGRAHAADRAILDLTEAWLLKDRIGESFAAIVLSADENAATIALDDPAVRARCTGAGLQIGQRITAKLTEANTSTRTVKFSAP